MKLYVYVYEGYAQFETVVLGYLAKAMGHEIVTFGNAKTPVASFEGFKTAPDFSVEEVTQEDADAIIIPGGNSYTAMGNESLKKLLKDFAATGKVMGAICHGPVLLAEAGVLEGQAFTSNVGEKEEQFALFKGSYVKEDVVKSGPFITATGNAYVEFAFAVAKELGIFAKDEDLNGYYNFFKNARELQFA